MESDGPFCYEKSPSSYTLWLCQNSDIENGPVEIVDFPMKNGDFP